MLMVVSSGAPTDAFNALSALVEVQNDGVTQSAANVDVAPYDPGYSP
jgi:hypothetical protein